MLWYKDRLNPVDIWQMRQNKPSYVARDLEPWVPREVTHAVLLARGVYKWLSVRRQLIKLKNEWKDTIRGTLVVISALKKSRECTGKQYDLAYHRGYLKAYEECRAQVRALCHSQRWQAPDFDKEARKFLKENT